MAPPTPDQIITAVTEAVDGFISGEKDFQFDLEKLKLQIRIQGPTWKGVVDKPIAKFVLDLDRRLTEELAKQGIEIPDSDHGIVSLRIDEGSTIAFLEGVPETLEQIRQFPPEQQMLIFIAILIVAGVWGGVKVVELLNEREEAKEETKKEEIRSNERLETIRAFTSKETVYGLEAPLRGLVNTLGANDKITLPGLPQPIKKAEMKERFEKSTRSRPRNYYIDHAYTVEGISTKDPRKWKINLKYGQITFNASLQLSEADLQTLLSDFQEAHENNTKIGPHLQVTAEINAKGVHKAVVVGIGEPRDNATKLSAALKAEGFTDFWR